MGKYGEYYSEQCRKRKEPVDNFNPAEWDCCNEHETTFPRGDECPECRAKDLKEKKR